MFFWSLVITFVVYALPIFIYRCIKGVPVAPKKAKRITVIYGIISLFIMNAVLLALNGKSGTGGSVLLWGFINYKILTNKE